MFCKSLNNIIKRNPNVKTQYPYQPPQRQSPCHLHQTKMRQEILSGFGVDYNRFNRFCTFNNLHRFCVFDSSLQQNFCAPKPLYPQRCLYPRQPSQTLRLRQSSPTDSAPFNAPCYRFCIFESLLHRACVSNSLFHRSCVSGSLPHRSCTFNRLFCRACAFSSLSYKFCVPDKLFPSITHNKRLCHGPIQFYFLQIASRTQHWLR